MGAYIIRRILISIPVLIGITIIGFVALKLDARRSAAGLGQPGGPGEPAARTRRSSKPSAIASASTSRSSRNQYLTWLGGVLQGDLGYSISSHRSIAYEIGSRLPQTLLLMVIALTMAILIGIPIGVITAVKQYSKLDYALNAAAIFLASTPVFVLGLIAIYVFAVNLHVAPDRPAPHGRADRSARPALAPDPAGDACWRSSTPRRSSATPARACSTSSTATT